MQINGISYLLTSEINGAEYVLRYEASEMAEIFTDAERAELESGEPLVQGTVRYVDMLVAARAIVA